MQFKQKCWTGLTNKQAKFRHNTRMFRHHCCYEAHTLLLTILFEGYKEFEHYDLLRSGKLNPVVGRPRTPFYALTPEVLASFEDVFKQQEQILYNKY